jgi:hypothetical protein
MMRDCRTFLALTIVALLGGCVGRPPLTENALLRATDLGPTVEAAPAAPPSEAAKRKALLAAKPKPLRIVEGTAASELASASAPPPMLSAAAPQLPLTPRRASSSPRLPMATSPVVHLGAPTPPTVQPARLAAPVAAGSAPAHAVLLPPTP